MLWFVKVAKKCFFLIYFFCFIVSVFFERESLFKSIYLMVAEDLTLVLFQFLFFFCESAYFTAHMGPGADKAEHCAYMTWFCMACLC